MRHPRSPQKARAETAATVRPSRSTPPNQWKGINVRDSSAQHAPMEEATYSLPPTTRLLCEGLRRGEKEARIFTAAGQPITPWMHRIADVQRAAASVVARYGRDGFVLRVVTDI
jgi:hypothetical protein